MFETVRRWCRSYGVWLLAAAFLTHLALTLPWFFDVTFNWEIWGFMTIPRLLLFALLETLLIGVALLGLWLVAGKRTWLPAVLVVGLTAVGIAQHYVMLFKSDIILPRDIFAMRTALSVSGQYQYKLSFGVVAGVVCAIAGIYALHCASVNARREPRSGSNSLPVNTACGLVCLAAVVAACIVPKYEQLGVGMEYWIEKAPTYYAVQGFLPTFIRCAQDLPIRVPGGYSDEAAEKLLAEYAQSFDDQRQEGDAYAQASAQWEEQKPSIVVVMDETFSDLSVFENLHAGYEGTTYVSKELPVLRRGRMGVSVFGGGTCNTEFEFLTGISLEALGSEKYPYSMYELDKLAALPKQLSELGYETIAMHPNDPENWNRAHVYPALGFDRFLDISTSRALSGSTTA